MIKSLTWMVVRESVCHSVYHPGVGVGAVAPIREVTKSSVEVTGGRAAARAGDDCGLGTCHTGHRQGL